MTTALRTPVHEFADRAWEAFLAANPLWATAQGDRRWDDQLDDPGPEGRARELAMVDAWEEEAARLMPVAVDVEDRITLGMIRVVAGLRRQAHAHELWQMEVIDQYAGPQSLMGTMARLQPIDDEPALQRVLARLERYPSWIEAHVGNIEAGVRRRRTAARPVVERVVTQTRRILDTPADESPLLAAAPGLDDRARADIVAAVERHVRPALVTWLRALEAYLPQARAGEGICHLPDGDELYRYHVLAWTTIVEAPASIHAYGLERLAALEAEERAICAELGFDDVSALRAFLDTDPSNRVTDPDDLVRLAEALIERTTDVAPRWFGRLPAQGCEVRPVEPHMEQEAPPAFYMPPTEDGSRSGVYFLNTFDPRSRHLHRMPATAYHEAVPGHHFQVAIEQELTDLPGFRRFGSRLAGGAYVEGWGLYAERLAAEMGLYHGPRERFGALESEAWRAVRLVVDTGIHAMGWTRQRSIDMLRERAGLSQLEAETETDRYISWPGQALSYMIGQREILALRAELEARDGDRFELQAFHDAVLGHGSLPLATLRAELPIWVRPRPD